MTIEGAIAVNTAVENYEICCWMPEALEAQKLGNEGLKRFLIARKNNVDIRPTLLLGETEE